MDPHDSFSAECVNNENSGRLNITIDPVRELEIGLDSWKKFRGIFYSLLTAIIYSLATLVIKKLSNYHPITVTTWYHAAVFFPFVPIFIYYEFINRRSNKSIFSSVFPVDSREKAALAVFVVLRAVLGSTSQIFHIWGLDYLSLGDSSIFAFSSSIFVVLIAPCFLQEKCGFVPIAIALLATFGIFLIVRPPFLTGQLTMDINNLYGVILATSSLILESFMIITLRRIRTVNFILVSLTFGLIGLLECLIVAWVLGVVDLPVGFNDSLLVYAALPITICSSNVFYSFALKLEEAGPVTIVCSLGIVCSFLLQFAFFDVMPDTYSLGGGAIVIFGVILITCRKYLQELPEEDRKRRLFKFLLL